MSLESRSLNDIMNDQRESRSHDSNDDVYRFSVAGVTFEGRQDIIDDVAIRIHGGEEPRASIVREPDNQYDPNACAVIVLDQKIGYVPRRLAEYVSKRIDGGHDVIVRSVEFYETLRGSSGCRVEITIR